MHPSTVAILRFFEYGHLPERLAAVSKHFHFLAHYLADAEGGLGLEGPEVTAALRKLLEAKDCAVRAALG